MKNLLNNLSIGQKLSLVIGVMLIQILLLLYMVITENTKAIAFSEKEIRGVEYNAALRSLLQTSMQHRGLAGAYLSGNAAVRNKLDAAEQDVNRAFDGVREQQSRHGEALTTTLRFQALQDEWKKLSADNMGMSAAESLAAHNAFITNGISFISYVGETSNLVLEGDFDAFYLMNVVTVFAPHMLDEMGKLRAMGAGVIIRNRITPEEENQMLLLTVSVESALNGLRSSLDSAYDKASDKQLRARLEAADKAFTPAAKKLIETVRKQILDTNGQATLSSQQYFELATQSIDAGFILYDGVVPELAKLLSNRVAEMRALLTKELLFIAACLMATILLAVYVTKGITGSMKRAITVFGSMAGGKLDNEIDVESKDETGQVMGALKSMQLTLKNNIDNDRKRAAETARLKQALDVATANIMVADTNNDIIYVNHSALAMFNNAERDIARDIPGFNASKLIGSNIDKFHKNPSHQRSLISTLKSAHNAGFVVGGRTMKFIANPVFGEANQRLGTVVEWQDRTLEVQVEIEVAAIVDAARSGDLSKRINESGKDGFYLQMSSGINQMIETVAESLEDIAQVMAGMSQGDLTHTITRKYSGRFGEVKDSVNTSIERLSETVEKIREASEFIRTSSEEISSGNRNLSQRAEQQASTLEETASSMEELTSTVKNNADSAQQANQLSVSARTLAEKGGHVVKDAVDAMSAITKSSHQIAEIIGVIDEIAFQTNLLALNASVEAARAGDQGRGFAVVASEVRNLAQRSASAAKEIKELIRDSEVKVQIGNKLVNESGVTLKDIVDAVKKVGDIVAEISSASQEQAAGIEEINKAITQMDEITQQNAALAEEASASSESSVQKATEMVEIVQFFRI